MESSKDKICSTETKAEKNQTEKPHYHPTFHVRSRASNNISKLLERAGVKLK